MGIILAESLSVQPNNSNSQNLGRIVGGSDALPGEFPHQVQLKYLGDHLCGATIISAYLILTAAHCVIHKGARRVKVVAGEHRLTINDTSEQYRDVRQILLHEDYNDKTFDNDIALLVMAKELEFNNVVKTALLPKENETLLDEAEVTGWGRMMEKVYSPGDTLQKVSIPFVNKTFCRDSYSLILRNITDKMLCAGAKGKDSCKADSGGPLTCKGAFNGLTYVCGIVSFGFGCGREAFPGIYTDVSKYYDWIQLKTKEIESNKYCPPETYRCDNDECVPNSFVCDLDDDCGDGSDEKEAMCFKNANNTPNNITVPTGFNITSNPWSYLTPTIPTFEVRCRQSQFRCKSTGYCIPYSWKCNGRKDCLDHSDEENCDLDFNVNFTLHLNPTVVTTNTPAQLLTTTNALATPTQPSVGSTLTPIAIASQPTTLEAPTTTMSVVPINISTPTVNSTSTTVQPIQANNCPGNFFQCKNLKCIPLAFVCDKDKDCEDASDEENCYVPTPRPNGGNNSVGEIHGEVELTVRCNSNQFHCVSSNKCIPISFKCDGDRDCGFTDSSDEDNCSNATRSCAINQFQCERSHQCIPENWKCDQDFDCIDHSDENNCDGLNSSTTVNLTLTTQITPVAIITDNRNGTGLGNSSNNIDADTVAVVEHIQVESHVVILSNTAPTITTTTTKEPSTVTSIAPLSTLETIVVSEVGIEVEAPRNRTSNNNNMIEEIENSASKCGRFQFQCRNGECISNRWRCDGHFDCSDRSDERSC